jgi:hypothetical protein
VPKNVAEPPVLTALDPLRVIEGGRLWLRGSGLPVPAAQQDLCTIDGAPARAVFAAGDRLAVEVPSQLDCTRSIIPPSIGRGAFT